VGGNHVGGGGATRAKGNRGDRTAGRVPRGEGRALLRRGDRGYAGGGSGGKKGQNSLVKGNRGSVASGSENSGFYEIKIFLHNSRRNAAKESFPKKLRVRASFSAYDCGEERAERSGKAAGGFKKGEKALAENGVADTSFVSMQSLREGGKKAKRRGGLSAPEEKLVGKRTGNGSAHIGV